MISKDDLRHDQLNHFAIIERVCSVFSLLGCVFIIATFWYSKTFHKPINRLAFYASFGNMMTNVGTLMARSYVNDPASPGCQFQAFLIQMFMPADTFWTLAMAVNVYLTFYHKFDAQKLRRMEVPYLIVCYGIPFIVALVYIFIIDPRRGRMYADATLWCWISPKWDIWRIATFYGPIWVVILLTFFIYIRAGGEIYRKHRQLRNFSSQHEPEPPMPPVDDPFSTKTTEVCVTSEAMDLSPLGRGADARRGSEASQSRLPATAAYSVTISSNKRQDNRQSYGETDLTIQSGPAVPAAARASISAASRYGTTATATAGPASRGAAVAPNNAVVRQRLSRESTTAAWQYTKCAILFFTAMLVTWIPSSANRVYSVVHGDQVNLTLEYMSAFVLPLQGFWNAIIYIVTSWRACEMLFHDMFLSRRPVTELIGYRPGGHHHAGAVVDRRAGGGSGGNSHRTGDSFNIVSSPSRSPRSDKNYESESMTELSSRPTSHEQGLQNESKPRMAV